MMEWSKSRKQPSNNCNNELVSFSRKRFSSLNCFRKYLLPLYPSVNVVLPAALNPTLFLLLIFLQVSYAVYEPENGHCNEIGLSTTYNAGVPGEGSGMKRIQIQPPTPLATVVLVDAQKSYRIIKADASDAVKILVPQGSIYPHTKFYVPVTVGKHDHQSIVAFIMRYVRNVISCLLI